MVHRSISIKHTNFYGLAQHFKTQSLQRLQRCTQALRAWLVNGQDHRHARMRQLIQRLPEGAATSCGWAKWSRAFFLKLRPATSCVNQEMVLGLKMVEIVAFFFGNISKLTSVENWSCFSGGHWRSSVPDMVESWDHQRILMYSKRLAPVHFSINFFVRTRLLNTTSMKSWTI